jgi:hypothetical protein
VAAVPVDGCRARPRLLPRRIRHRLVFRRLRRARVDRTAANGRQRVGPRLDHDPGSRRGTAPTDATTTQGDATSTAEDATATAPASQRDDDEGEEGNAGNGGGPPPAPPAGSIDFDYGRWDGVFEVDNPEITPDFGFAAVTGEFRYLGGIDCQGGLIVAKVWFYDGRGRRIGDGIWVELLRDRRRRRGDRARAASLRSVRPGQRAA